MDASTIIYITLGLGALILQGYMEKKKKEQVKQRREESFHEEIGFHEEMDFHEEPSAESLLPPLSDTVKHSEYQMIDIPLSSESEEGISSFKHMVNEAPEQEEAKDGPVFAIDPRNLVLYSEIMAPKFRE